MLQWYSVCSFCGAKDISRKASNCLYCALCQKDTYINRSCAVGCYFYNDEKQILIVQRARDPWKWKYQDPGGFMDIEDMSAEAAVVREVHEELWIIVDPKSLNYLSSGCRNYPYQERDMPVVCLQFYAYISPQQISELQVSDDVSWFLRIEKNTFDPTMMSLSYHATVIEKVFDIIGA